METACSPVMYNSSLGDWVIPCYFLEVSQHHSGLLKALLMFKYLEYVKHHRSCWRYWTKSAVRETNWRSGFHLPHMVTFNSWMAEQSLMSLGYQRETWLFGCLIRKDKREDLEGAGGEGGGRGDWDGEDMLTQGLFNSMYDKIHYKEKNK